MVIHKDHREYKVYGFWTRSILPAGVSIVIAGLFKSEGQLTSVAREIARIFARLCLIALSRFLEEVQSPGIYPIRAD